MKLKCLAKVSQALIKSPLNFEFGGVLFKFTAHIKIVDQDEIDKITSSKNASDATTARGLLVGREGFSDDGKDVAFDSETLDEMLRFGGIAGKLSVECINAQYRVQEKN